MNDKPTYIRKADGTWRATPPLSLEPTYTRQGVEVPGFLVWVSDNRAKLDHLKGFLSFLHEEEYLEQPELDYALGKPWKFSEAYQRFTSSLDPSGPQDLDPDKQALQDRRDRDREEGKHRWTRDMSDEEIPF
jgi:hypothetical protein